MVNKYLYGHNAIKSYLKYITQEKIDGKLLISRNSKHSDLIELAVCKGVKCVYISNPRANSQSRSQRLPQLLLPHLKNDLISLITHRYNDINTFFSFCTNNKSSTIVLLDNITDVHNIGAIVRSASFFSLDAVISRVKLSSLAEPTLAHVSAGSVFNIPLLFGCNLHQVLKLLKTHEYWIVGLDHEHGNQFHNEVWHRKKIVFLLGSEDRGISSLSLSQCDYLYQIAGSSIVDSLNVSVAAGIAFANRYVACQSHVAN